MTASTWRTATTSVRLLLASESRDELTSFKNALEDKEKKKNTNICFCKSIFWTRMKDLLKADSFTLSQKEISSWLTEGRWSKKACRRPTLVWSPLPDGWSLESDITAAFILPTETTVGLLQPKGSCGVQLHQPSATSDSSPRWWWPTEWRRLRPEGPCPKPEPPPGSLQGQALQTGTAVRRARLKHQDWTLG